MEADTIVNKRIGREACAFIKGAEFPSAINTIKKETKYRRLSNGGESKRQVNNFKKS
jgi:hypothetical protein